MYSTRRSKLSCVRVPQDLLSSRAEVADGALPSLISPSLSKVEVSCTEVAALDSMVPVPALLGVLKPMELDALQLLVVATWIHIIMVIWRGTFVMGHSLWRSHRIAQPVQEVVDIKISEGCCPRLTTMVLAMPKMYGGRSVIRMRKHLAGVMVNLMAVGGLTATTMNMPRGALERTDRNPLGPCGGNKGRCKIGTVSGQSLSTEKVHKSFGGMLLAGYVNGKCHKLYGI
mmetsp:Transcript_4208/g.6162  ORF Transcript_4208/g.6162 Transcript_4208/m.6162 type:complete len:229 (-) Transcript_4208:2167-2853(-)